MDSDLDAMTREQLAAEVRRLRAGIRPLPTVPEWPQFLWGCIRYRQSLDEQAPAAPRTSEPFER